MITCNWCETALSDKCKYVLCEGLPLSCCKRCYRKFCKLNEHIFYDYYHIFGTHEEIYEILQEIRVQKISNQWDRSSVVISNLS